MTLILRIENLEQRCPCYQEDLWCPVTGCHCNGELKDRPKFCPIEEELNPIYEKKYRYLLYRIQQALLEMDTIPKSHRGRRHLENGLYCCEQTLNPTERAVTHDEMTAIKNELFDDIEKNRDQEMANIRAEILGDVSQTS